MSLLCAVLENRNGLLERCPYCQEGGEEIVVMRRLFGVAPETAVYFVACNRCNARGGDCQEVGLAISSWNQVWRAMYGNGLESDQAEQAQRGGNASGFAQWDAPHRHTNQE